MGSYGLFDLKEVVQWVCTSVPTGCSPQGLGGISDPFKGFKSSGPIWGRRGIVLSGSYCDALCPDTREGGEVPRFLHMWGVG
jgi:hypothetical protein